MDEFDHRVIGKRLDLFHLQEEAPGMIFWHPRGQAVFRNIENVLRRYMRRAGYREVRSPLIMSRSFWEASGHWDKFRKNMFAVEGDEYAVKPMNCPGHVQIYNDGLRSYRDLPFRLFEFGIVHRNEASGALHGLLRARSFTIDDSHVLCAEHQVEDEVRNFCSLLRSVYRDFGFEDIQVKFSTRPAERAGDDEIWDKAEAALAAAAQAAGMRYEVQPGEGAFYGPKLEFVLRDNHGRDWQCGTVQLDFVLPGRLGTKYIGDDGKEHVPVMIHHAVLGSLERFIGMMLEHHRGRLPVSLAPEQILVFGISQKYDELARDVAVQLEDCGIRVRLDCSNERANRKAAIARELEVPVFLGLGQREQDGDALTLRWLDGHEDKLDDISAVVAALKAS